MSDHIHQSINKLNHCVHCGKPMDSQAPSSFAAPTLLAAVELACDKWSWIQAGTREPLSTSLKRTEREMDVFEMIVSMNNLRTQFEKWKAANNQVSDGGGS